ncbi:MAG: trypsin-like peptidase domain-containing protein [Planctomycetota bacterium]|nr:MAG: trypsin-like peptidase domain-containing protein [Planctomycetota bacterium]
MYRILPNLLPSILLVLPMFILPAQAGEDINIQSSVVKIFSSQSPPNMFRPWEITPPSDATGSGVLIEEGRILTNAHVVAYAQQIYVQPHESSNKLDATVEYIAEECDLATLKLDEPEEIEDLKPVPLDDKLPALKTTINVLGYPTGGDTLSVTEGVVSRIEYASYSYTGRALRIQVDAAINPGNSGGPGIVDNKIVGIVFSKFPQGENIGYLIPTQVIRQFLNDCTSDGKHDGFPKIGAVGATLENPDVRKYLKMTKDITGVVIHKITRWDNFDLIKPWDVITACDGTDIDNLGMVAIDKDIRVHWAHLISSKAPGSSVKLSVWRNGKEIEIEVATRTNLNTMIQKMANERPTYFIYGGLVFSPVTTEMTASAGSRSFAYLGYAGRLLPQYVNKFREKVDDEVVVICCPILPHKLTKGYGITPMSVVTHVNDQPVRNLRHLIQLIKDNKEEFLIFRFEEDYEEKIVLDPKRVEKYQAEILRNNNIPAACSDDLKDIWP